MTAEANANDQELARAKTTRTIAIVVAVVAFAVLVYGFGMLWKPWYQVLAGVAAYACVEWQRRCGQKIKELEGKKAA